MGPASPVSALAGSLMARPFPVQAPRHKGLGAKQHLEGSEKANAFHRVKGPWLSGVEKQQTQVRW